MDMNDGRMKDYSTVGSDRIWLTTTHILQDILAVEFDWNECVKVGIEQKN